VAIELLMLIGNQGDVNTQDQMEKLHGSPMLRKEWKEMMMMMMNVDCIWYMYLTYLLFWFDKIERGLSFI
jgi:hypothetical protein